MFSPIWELVKGNVKECNWNMTLEYNFSYIHVIASLDL
jgi:hypothetical protein